MASFRLIRCSIKFQLCVGHFPDGRMRTRTFGIGGVRPDLTADDVAAVARAVAPLLAHPVVRVRFVRKYAVEAMFIMPRITGRRGRRPLRLHNGSTIDPCRGDHWSPVGALTRVLVVTTRARMNQRARNARPYDCTVLNKMIE